MPPKAFPQEFFLRAVHAWLTDKHIITVGTFHVLAQALGQGQRCVCLRTVD